MSHVSKIEIEIKSLWCLKMACVRLGFQFKENQKTHKWYGVVVNPEKYPIPEGIRQDQLGRCDHAIHVPEAEYEIGVIKVDDKFILVTDFWDTKLKNRIGENGGLLKQAYAIERTIQEAKKRSFRILEQRVPNGVRLVLCN